MYRYEMIKVLLKKQYYSLEKLAYRMSTDLKFIREDMELLKDNLEGAEVLLRRPPKCKDCGFEFTGDRTKPTKCPECNSEAIRPAQFKVSEETAEQR